MAKTEMESCEHVLLKKAEVADVLRVSVRQVELLTKQGAIPAPVYLSPQAPRWRRSELLNALGISEA